MASNNVDIDFEFIKEIKDNVFLEALSTLDGDLYTICKLFVEDYKNERFTTLIKNVRDMNNNLILHLYKRFFNQDFSYPIFYLVGKDLEVKKDLEKKPIYIAEGIMKKRTEFRGKVNDTFLEKADKQRIHGNDQTHETRRRIDPEIEAKDALIDICDLLKSTVSFLDKGVQEPYLYNNSSKIKIDGYAKITKKTEGNEMQLSREEGKVKIERNINFRSNYWAISGSEKKPDNGAYKKGKSTLILEKEHVGKYIHGYISFKGYSGRLDAVYGPICDDDFLPDITGKITIEECNINDKYCLRLVFENTKKSITITGYQWNENDTPIEGENAEYFYPTVRQVGKKISCTIFADGMAKKTSSQTIEIKETMFKSMVAMKTPVYELSLEVGKYGNEDVVWAILKPDDIGIANCSFKWAVVRSDGHIDKKKYIGQHLGLKGITTGEKVCCEVKILDKDINLKRELLIEESSGANLTNDSTVELMVEDSTTNRESSEEEQTSTTESSIEQSAPGQEPQEEKSAPKPVPPVDEPAPEPEPIPQPDPDPEPPVDEPDNGDGRIYAREIKLPYEMKRVSGSQEEFFTSTALVHYFVRSDDYFALNSLELVSADMYLYRLLKVSKFEHIYFIDVDDTKCVIYAYDDVSKEAFPSQGKKKTLSGIKTIEKTTIEKSSAEGVANNIEKREIRIFTTPQELNMLFPTAIKNTLNDTKHKSAVVMSVRLFGKEGYCTDPVIDTLGSMLKNNDTENAMIITLPSKSDFLECFKTKQADIHDWINSVLNEAGSTNSERLSAAIDILLKQGRLLVADEYHVDEFANMLLRKKLIEENEGLVDIRFAKIYAVAELLRDYLMNENTLETFESLPKIKGNLLKELNYRLNKETVCAEIVKKASRLNSVKVGYSRKLNPLQLERVYHEYYDRYENNNTVDEVMRQFDQFAGEETQEIISQIVGVVSFLADERIRIDEQRRSENYSEEMPYMNMVFFGNPGTGKTTIAKLTAKYMKAMGVLPSDRFEYITASAETEGIVGNTAANIREAAQRAVGGVLMIDEFQGFEQAYQGGNVAKNALEAIVGIINSHRDDLCIIIAGYKDGVETVLKHDQGADRRFPENNRFLFKDFSSDTLLEILHTMIERRGEKIEDGADEILKTVIENKIHDESRNFGNAGYIEAELLPALEIAKSKREKGSKIITIEDINAAYPNVERAKLSKADILGKFDALIGDEMKSVKNEIMEAAAVFKDAQDSIKAMKERGETPDEDDMPYMNMIFAGGPGTGKTTIAKLTAKYLREEGILPTDKYVYITATQEVEGTVGETEKRIREAARNAVGGVLFIDEFQGFDKGHSNGNMAQDAMSAIVSIVNVHREDMCIILAGYQQGVDKVLRFDVGAKRRFPNRINFKDYSVDTLMLILESRLEKMKWGMEEEAKPLVRTVIEQHKKDSAGSFGNGGYIKDELLPMLNRKRLKRTDNNGVFIRQDVIEAFPEILGGKNVDQIWKPRKISKKEMESIDTPYELRERNPEELQKVTDDAILYVTTDHGQGTAFLIHPDGYALTCNHVIRDAKEINARVRIKGRAGGDDSTHKCTVINAREDLDMAVIKLEGSNFPYIPLAQKSRNIRKGEGFILSGYPFGKKTEKGMTTYPGTIATSGEHTDKAGFTTYFISGEAKSGNSGSPIISLTDGLVIGILCGSLDEKSTATKTEEINYMRPVYYFWEEFVKWHPMFSECKRLIT